MVREELYPMWMVSQVGKLILKLETISCQKEQSPLHIRQLSNQIEKLSPLLQKLCGRSWSDLAAQSAFSALYGALEGTFRVADKWRTCEVGLILLSDVFGHMFIEEIGEKLNEAQECLQKVARDALNYICSKSKEAKNRGRKLQSSQSSGLKLSRPR